MIKKALFSALFCLCLLPSPARAAYVTGDGLLKLCRSAQPKEIYACMNYVAGVIDYHVMLQSLGTAPVTSFCLPPDMTIEKASVTVMMYLQHSPQNGAFIAAPTVALALSEAYPCNEAAPPPKKKKKK